LVHTYTAYVDVLLVVVTVSFKPPNPFPSLSPVVDSLERESGGDSFLSLADVKVVFVYSRLGLLLRGTISEQGPLCVSPERGIWVTRAWSGEQGGNSRAYEDVLSDR